jgi:hypothetical protein
VVTQFAAAVMFFRLRKALAAKISGATM